MKHHGQTMSEKISIESTKPSYLCRREAEGMRPSDRRATVPPEPSPVRQPLAREMRHKFAILVTGS
jgi:hypothetical protein